MSDLLVDLIIVVLIQQSLNFLTGNRMTKDVSHSLFKLNIMLNLN